MYTPMYTPMYRAVPFVMRRRCLEAFALRRAEGVVTRGDACDCVEGGATVALIEGI